MIRTYHRRPNPVEIADFDGTNAEEILAWAAFKMEKNPIHVVRRDDEVLFLTIDTLHGEMACEPGMCIVCRLSEPREFWPIYPEVRDADYEESAE